MKTQIPLIIIFFLIITTACTRTESFEIDLSGKWLFSPDPEDRGIKEQWYSKKLNEEVILPGSMNSNGKGDPIGIHTNWTGKILDSSFFKNPEYKKYREPENFKVPFWLQPLKHYQGVAWYQKEVDIPSTWSDKQISLFLERCHWESRLWINNLEVGMCNSLGTPHNYDLTKYLKPGRHILTLCIDNRIKDVDPGINSHSISDHSQTNWNGVVGKLYLEARPLLKIQSVQVYPDIKKNNILALIDISNLTKQEIQTELVLQVSGASILEKKIQELNIKKGQTHFEIEYPMGDEVKLWDEFNPNLYQLKIVLRDQQSDVADSLLSTFGMRSFTTNGKQIEVNGHPVFLRGVVECCVFPKTGYPPTEEEEWVRIFRICHAHGLNHMRFHSWCPPEAAFKAADKAGFYLQVECSSWANKSTTLGDGKPIDKYLYEESKRIVDAYGNHPSFCLMAYGNEPIGEKREAFLNGFVNFWKNKDSRRIYTSGAGWPNLSVNDYLSDPSPRIQSWGGELESIINAEAPRTDYDWSAYIGQFSQPMVCHETGQWCVYPNFKEIVKYNGALRARNFEIFQQSLKENGMEHLADSFLLASGKLQALCYKADIEAALRTKDLGGFQLLDLHDFPGQGTALVGILDAFWDEKGYISPQEFKRFCNTTVPLVRMKKRIFNNKEKFEADIEIAHYGKNPLIACSPEWKIINQSGIAIDKGKLATVDIPIGNGTQLGTISSSLVFVNSAEKLTLEVSVDTFSNKWDFWVYPAEREAVSKGENIRVTQSFDDATIKYLEEGGSVLFNLKKGTLPVEMGGDVKIGFSSIFWNTAWTQGQAPHTLGILCNPMHPSLNEFPTEYHSNWQWWDAMSHSETFDLSYFSPKLKPIVRVIDDWFTNRPLALIFEAKIGKGKILVSGVDLQSELDNRLEARQLLYSLKRYMAGEYFNPTVEINPEEFILIEHDN